jgi:hypothetical protein
MAETEAAESVTQLCGGLLNALEAFDRAHPPYGLYASDELVTSNPRRHYYEEWHRGLKPYLESIGAKVADFNLRSRQPIAYFDLPGVGSSRIKVLTLSKIKVRKYGSRYRVDRHESFDERWLESDIGKSISVFWKQAEPDRSDAVLGLVVFIGYDKAQRPFEAELVQLKELLKWDRHGVVYCTRTWQDIYERGFGIRTCVWAKYSEAGISLW